MLSRFEVTNYKNFKEKLTIDFKDTSGYQFNTDCITNGMISKMLIYGRNATGKTNLGKAILDIISNLSPVGIRALNSGTFLNADSSCDYAEFKYTFEFDKVEVVYRYTKLSDYELRDEELFINGRRIFYFDFMNKEGDFLNLSYINADTVVVDRFLQANESDEDAEKEVIRQSLPFLRWIISNTALTSDSVLLRLSDYVNRMSMSSGEFYMRLPRVMYEKFYESLEKEDNLRELEDFMNAMGVKCKLIMKKLPDGQRELYFKHNRLVPFVEGASSGTLALINLYRRYVIGRNASFMYIDEFDAFYHYEMAENIVKFLKSKYPGCQIILTSHNTNLMNNRIMRPDCLFILSPNKLTALCNATNRELREGHNLEKMYISGEFEKYE